MKKSALAFLFMLVVSYFGFSFICWEFNPGNWTEGWRLSCMMFGSMFGLVLGAAVAGLT